MSKVSDAVDKFKSGNSCSQAVFSVYGEELGIDHKTAMKVSSVFAGGMRIGEVCGAVTGALMAIGLKHCSSNGETVIERIPAYNIALSFYSKFLERNSSLLCKDLLGADISTPEGKSIIESQNLHRLCSKFVQDAAEILEEIL
jgi:C_GCAxxG_C_C family probable redox protein